MEPSIFCKSLYTKPLKHKYRPIKEIHTEDKAQKYTMQASVTIETGHSGHIEDLLKKPSWQYYSLYTLRAETQTVTTLQEQQTDHSTSSNNC